MYCNNRYVTHSADAFLCIGILTNIASACIYSRPHMWRRSSGRYLTALSGSDMCVCITGILVISADSIRGVSPLLNQIYVFILPYTMPFMSTIQMLSIYMTCCAAVDCFVSVWFPKSLAKQYCTAEMSSTTIWIMTVIVWIYNLPVFFELRAVNNCFSNTTGAFTQEVCPTWLLQNELYYNIKNVGYTLFFALIPFVLLVILNLLIIVKVANDARKVQLSPPSTGDKMMITPTKTPSLHSVTLRVPDRPHEFVRRGNTRTSIRSLHHNNHTPLSAQASLASTTSSQRLRRRNAIRIRRRLSALHYREDDANGGGGTLMLIMVVMLFLICNSISLAVVLLEMLVEYEE